MKRSPLRRKTPLPAAPLTTGRRRKPSEFARIYGSKARVAWVKSVPCLVCGRTPSDNAHMPSQSGVGRKGDYTNIVPLCRTHHAAFDEHRAPFNDPARKEWGEKMAAWTERAWQGRSGGPEHISSVVARVMEEL